MIPRQLVFGNKKLSAIWHKLRQMVLSMNSNYVKIKTFPSKTSIFQLFRNAFTLLWWRTCARTAVWTWRRICQSVGWPPSGQEDLEEPPPEVPMGAGGGRLWTAHRPPSLSYTPYRNWRYIEDKNHPKPNSCHHHPAFFLDILLKSQVIRVGKTWSGFFFENSLRWS